MAASIRPESRAASISWVNRPLPPISVRVRSWMRSPLVVITSRTASWSPPSTAAMRARTVSAWARARGLPLVPMRIGCAVMARRLRHTAPLRQRVRPSVSSPPLTVLGIETSCDETAAAVVRLRDGRAEVLSSIVGTQTEAHAPYGGVVPEIAARSHVETIDGIAAAALREAGLGVGELDGIAATAGPGLVGGVMVGLAFGKAMALALGKPLVAVNHLEGHAVSARLTAEIPYPFLLLLVSGGHCQLLDVRGVGACVRLGSTLDDAAGEAFDKIGVSLGLPYPAGPALERLAEGGDAERFPLPRSLLGHKGCDFSFSGLKTAAARLAQGLTGEIDRRDLAAAAQGGHRAASSPSAPRRAMSRYREAPWRGRATAGGRRRAWRPMARCGVGCRRWPTDEGFAFFAPPLAYCTDNAAMIALAGAERLALGLTDDLDAPARPRWPLDEAPPGSAPPTFPAAREPRHEPRGRTRRRSLGHRAGPGLRPGWAGDHTRRRASRRSPPRSTRSHENTLFLPGAALDPGIRATTDVSDLSGCDLVFAVTPAQHLRRSLAGLSGLIEDSAPIVLCAKGIEQGTLALMSEVLAETLPHARGAVLSGPSFAGEVARGLPTAVTLASRDLPLAHQIAHAIAGPVFRPYVSDDPIGAEAGGAVKNVLAIACGIVEGRGLGRSAHAALITRGFAELTRLAVALGGEAETVAGLCGLGDLVLTCSSPQSRNMSLGLALGRGERAGRLPRRPEDRRRRARVRARRCRPRRTPGDRGSHLRGGVGDPFREGRDRPCDRRPPLATPQAGELTMATFVLICHDRPGALDLRMATREAHLAWVGENLAKVVRAGPLLTDEDQMAGSLFVVEAADEAAVRAFHQDDPYAKAGLFERVEILRWRQTVGAP